MAIEHENITDPYLHEPKGAATATSGEVYVSDGAGSGVWDRARVAGQDGAALGQVFTSDGAGGGIWKHVPQGWGKYKDDAAAQNFGTTYTKLSIDALGATTEEGYLPRIIRGVGSLWDSTADKITPIAVGDSYNIRLDLPIAPSTGSPDKLEVVLDIGGTVSPTAIILLSSINITGFSSYTLSLNLPVFCLTTFKNNGGQIFLRVNAGSIDVTKPGIFIDRNTDGSL